MSEEILDEVTVLTPMQRRKRAIIMRRNKRKLKVARNRWRKKFAKGAMLKRRGRKSAIRAVRAKVAGNRGKNYTKLSSGEKMGIDKRVHMRKKLISRIARRNMPQVRKKEMSKFRTSSVNYLGNILEEKRYHKLLNAKGTPTTDKRFKMYRQKVANEDWDIIHDIMVDESWQKKIHNKNEQELMDKALTAIDHIVKKRYQSAESAAYSVLRAYNLPFKSRQLANMYRKVYDVKEEVDQIDELSSATLASYQEKADAKRKKIKQKLEKEWDHKPSSMEDGNKSIARMHKLTSKHGKILHGISRANKRVNEESQIDEISDRRMKAYAKKAKRNIKFDKSFLRHEADKMYKKKPGPIRLTAHSLERIHKYHGGNKVRKTNEEVEQMNELSPAPKTSSSRPALPRPKPRPKSVPTDRPALPRPKPRPSRSTLAPKTSIRPKARSVIVKSRNPKTGGSRGHIPVQQQQESTVTEQGGAGFQGTDALIKKYLKDTPGQKKSGEILKKIRGVAVSINLNKGR